MNLIITPNIVIQGLLFDEQISSIISNATKYGLMIYAPTTLYSDISSNYPYIQSKRSLDRAELVNLYNQLSKSLNLYFYPFNEPIIEVPRESRELRIFYNFDKYLSLAKFLGADAVWDGNTFDDLPNKYDSLPNKSLIYGIPIISSNKLFKIINENSIVNESTYRTYFLGFDKPSAPFYPENQAQKSTKSLIEILTQQLTTIYSVEGTPEIAYHLGTPIHKLMNSDYAETNIFVPIFALVSYLWLDKPSEINLEVVFSYRTFSKGKGDRIRKVKQYRETGEEETVEIKIAGPDLNGRIFLYSENSEDMASKITEIVGDNWSGRFSHDQISNGEEVGVFKFKLNFNNITNSKFIEAFSEQSKILNPFKVNYESIKNSFDRKVLSEMASIYLGNNFFITLMEGTELANLTELSVVLDDFTKYEGVGTKADYFTPNKELKPGIIIENKGRKTANEKFGETLKALDEGADQVAWTIFKSIYGEASQKYDRGVVVSLSYFSGKPIRMMIEFITSDEAITERSTL